MLSSRQLLLIYSLICIAPTQLIAQQDSMVLKVSFAKDKLEADDDFIIAIQLTSFHKSPIFIDSLPVYTTLEQNFGSIKFRLQKLQDSCFVDRSVDMDPFGTEFNESLIGLKANDSIQYKFDLRNVYVMRKGVYRLKVYFAYSKSQKWLDKESSWLYFTVLNDEHRGPKNGKLF